MSDDCPRNYGYRGFKITVFPSKSPPVRVFANRKEIYQTTSIELASAWIDEVSGGRRWGDQ